MILKFNNVVVYIDSLLFLFHHMNIQQFICLLVWWFLVYQFSSFAQLCLTLCEPHEPQHSRPPYPSPIARVYPNPCLLSRYCHPTISSSVIPFSSCPQSFPASGSFPTNQLFALSVSGVPQNEMMKSQDSEGVVITAKIDYKQHTKYIQLDGSVR